MNRPPGKSDTWWTKHEAECGGTYTKIQEPELTKKQRDALSKKERAGMQKNKLDSWVKVGKKDAGLEDKASSPATQSSEKDKTSSDRLGTKRKTETIALDEVISNDRLKRSRANESDKDKTQDEDKVLLVEEKVLVECPICSMRIAESNINEHLDMVHPS